MGLEIEGESLSFEVRGLAGDRQITFRRPTAEALLDAMYKRLN
jgi:hypothetical protein